MPYDRDAEIHKKYWKSKPNTLKVLYTIIK